MLADTLERYKEREKSLISDFKKLCHNNYHEMVGENDIGDSLVEWVERFSPRRFGKVLNGEIALCRQIAQQTGILLDPMYTLAGWEQAVDLCVGDSRTKVVMIHTGGTLGFCGLAQRCWTTTCLVVRKTCYSETMRPNQTMAHCDMVGK
jgi:D-cysteine desulfhydrase